MKRLKRLFARGRYIAREGSECDSRAFTIGAIFCGGASRRTQELIQLFANFSERALTAGENRDARDLHRREHRRRWLRNLVERGAVPRVVQLLVENAVDGNGLGERVLDAEESGDGGSGLLHGLRRRILDEVGALADLIELLVRVSVALLRRIQNVDREAQIEEAGGDQTKRFAVRELLVVEDHELGNLRAEQTCKC